MVLRKKFASFVAAPVIAFAFAVALLAVPGGAAFAATSISQSDLDAAGGCYTLKDGSYELGQDITGGFKVAGSATLDLKGHTVTNSANQGVFSLASGGKSLTVSNGTVVQKHTNNAAFRNETNSTLVITDVTATSYDHVCIDNEAGTTVVNSGTYTVNNSEKSASVIRNGGSSGIGVTINGGTFSAAGNAPSNLIDASNGTVKIAGASCFSSFPSKAQLDTSLYMLKTDKGFEAVGDSGLADALWKVSGISGSRIDSVFFLSTADKDAFLQSYKGSAEPYKGYTVSVSTNLEGKSASITVARGEKFSSSDLFASLGLDKRYYLESTVDEEGNAFSFDTAVNSDLSLTATFKQVVSYIGSTGYETLQAALDAVNNNEIIELCDDVTENATAENGKTFTLDLGGKTLTAKSDDEPALKLTKSSKVTVKNGVINASSNAVYMQGDMYSSSGSNALTLEDVKASSSVAAAVRAEYGTVSIKSGTYTATSSSAEADENSALYLAGATATIEGGSFTAAGSTKNAVSVMNRASLTVNAGKFADQIDGSGGTLAVNGGTFGSYANLGAVAEGKSMLKHKDAGYEVLDTSDAMAAACCVVVNASKQSLYFEDATDGKEYADAQAGSKVTRVCHVSFDSDGGTEVATQDLLSGGTVSAPDPAPTKEGYAFVGWQLSGADYSFDAPVTEDIALKAKWSINTYTVSFLNDDGSTFKTQQVEYGKKVSAPETVPTKEGWAFAAWTLDEKAYDFDTPVKGDIELKPGWNQIFTVSFVDENGDVLAPEQKVENGKCVSAPDPAPAKEGYTLKGWKSGQDDFDFKTPITADTTLTASWEVNTYTVTFKTDGGSKVESQKVKYNECATAPDAPTKTGYEFVGWQLDGKDFNFESTPITTDITLVAKWTEKEYTVTFDTDGGSLAPEQQKVKYGEYATQPEVPTKDGKGFIGWFVVDEDGEISDDDEDYFYFGYDTVTEDITLRAKWGNAVVENNGKLYAYFCNAVENAQPDSTVKLLADDESDYAFAEIGSKNLTIDLGNKTLGGKGYSGILAYGASNVFVKNGEIKYMRETGLYAQGDQKSSAKVTLQNVDIHYAGEESSEYGLQAAVVASHNSEITIEGGDYSQKSGVPLLCIGGKIKVNNGTFAGSYESENYVAGVAAGTLEINDGIFDGSVHIRDVDDGTSQSSSLASAAESFGAAFAALTSSESLAEDRSDSSDQSATLIINGGKFASADNYASLASGKVFFKHAASGDAKAYYEVMDESAALKSHCWKAAGSTGTIYFESKDEAVAYAGDESKVEELTPEPEPTPTPASTDLASAKVTLSSASFTYDGKAQKPSVKSVELNGKTLKEGTDYTASVASGKKVGTYAVTITAKGSYTGKATTSFTINPKGVTKFKVSKAKKSFKAKWKKAKAQRSGVQMRYSTKKSMANAKTVKAKGASAKAKTVKKLKKKTKYYVQARTYKVVNGKTYYSSWSAKKAVKTK